MSRDLLHISKLKAFISWLDRTNRGWRLGKGPYQVIQVMTDNSGWQVVFRRDSMPEHYSINAALEPIVERFIHEERVAKEVAARAIDPGDLYILDPTKPTQNPPDWPDTQKLDLPVLEDALGSIGLQVDRPPWEAQMTQKPCRCGPDGCTDSTCPGRSSEMLECDSPKMCARSGHCLLQSDTMKECGHATKAVIAKLHLAPAPDSRGGTPAAEERGDTGGTVQ
jgi:hypothetical protein